MTGQAWTRRRLLRTAGLAGVTGLAGCTGEFVESPRPPRERTATDESGTGPNGSSSTGTDTPGYKKYHWHGRLFFEIDGELVDFSKSKYYLDNIDREEAVYFHFHPGGHGPNEWSNEKKIVTFDRALDLLPGIAYEQADGGAHVVEYDGERYRGSASGTDVATYEGTESIDPTQYTVQHDDNFWVQVDTGDGGGSSGDGRREGKLLVDVNNRRLSLTGSPDVDGFGFPSDGEENTWYSEGGVTLADALNAVPQLRFETRGGSPALTYQADGELGGTYTGGDGTELLFRQRWNDVDPTAHELADGDILWVYVHSSHAPDNEH